MQYNSAWIHSKVRQILSQLSNRPFFQKVRENVLSEMCESGGFYGRKGDADPYYTRFGLQILDLLGTQIPNFKHHEAFLKKTVSNVQTFEQWFSVLSSFEIINVSIPIRSKIACLGMLLKYAFHFPAALRIYDIFILGLIFQHIRERFLFAKIIPIPWTRIIKVIKCRAVFDGGFSELEHGIHTGQTNPTAAGILVLCNAPKSEKRDALLKNAVEFILKQQRPTGGFAVSPAAPCDDLLTTFTSIIALRAAGVIHRVKQGQAARFLRTVTTENGFSAVPGDSVDVEFIYYGLMVWAMLEGITNGVF